MANKFYRVKHDTFMWLKGAIIQYDAGQGSSGGYEAISDLWDAVELRGEYISSTIIESKENARYFERVHEISVLGKAKYLTTEKARQVHDEIYKEKK